MATAVRVPGEVRIFYKEGVPWKARVGWNLLVTDDDGKKHEIPQGVEPLNIGQGKGFPLKDILDQSTIGALVTISEQDSKIKDLERKARGRKDAVDAGLLAQIAAKDAEIEVLKLPEKEKRKAEIQAEIDRLQKAKDDLDKAVKPK